MAALSAGGGRKRKYKGTDSIFDVQDGGAFSRLREGGEGQGPVGSRQEAVGRIRAGQGPRKGGDMEGEAAFGSLGGIASSG